jgi:hypothetical protein
MNMRTIWSRPFFGRIRRVLKDEYENYLGLADVAGEVLFQYWLWRDCDISGDVLITMKPNNQKISIQVWAHFEVLYRAMQRDGLSPP